MKVGFFDSGIGGLTIAREFCTLMPDAEWLYVADQKYNPYGQLSPEELLARCECICQKLVSEGCQLIVVACNTATVNVIQHLRTKFKRPFVGVEPAIKPAARMLDQANKKDVFVWATQATISSNHYRNLVEQYLPHMAPIDIPCIGLADQIELAHLKVISRDVVEPFLSPVLAKKEAILVLGCTHYAWLIPMIQERLHGQQVTLVNSAQAVARQIVRQIEGMPQQKLNNTNNRSDGTVFYTSGSPVTLRSQIEYWWPELAEMLAAKWHSAIKQLS